MPETTNHLLPDASGLIGLVALALACVGGLVWGMTEWDARARVPTTVQAAPGTFLRIPLSDGSEVLLREGASLRYPRQFGDVRGVGLAGEAYVRARRGATPFVLTTSEATVTTLAARFDVRAASGRTRVAVERGALHMAPRSQPQSASAMAVGDIREVRLGGTAEAPPGETASGIRAWRTPPAPQ